MDAGSLILEICQGKPQETVQYLCKLGNKFSNRTIEYDMHETNMEIIHTGFESHNSHYS